MNEEIRKEVKASGLKMWEVAERAGIPESSFYRMLRHKLEPEAEKKIFGAIESLKEGKVCETLRECDYVSIPSGFLRDERLTVEARFLMLYIQALKPNHTLRTTEELATAIGMSVESVQHNLGLLHEFGLLETKEEGGEGLVLKVATNDAKVVEGV